MQLTIIAASSRQPEWVETAFTAYAKRFSGALRLQYTQVRLAKNPAAGRRRAEEGEKLLAAVPRSALLVALDEAGQSWSTRRLAALLEGWIAEAARPCFVIGGPDGLDPAVLEAARLRWSLSALTLPHALARIIVAESLYRASSLLSGHPYHRE
jgi:23S rRNA (pseudouridine1915-N3)-methyltransferase